MGTLQITVFELDHLRVTTQQISSTPKRFTYKRFVLLLWVFARNGVITEAMGDCLALQYDNKYAADQNKCTKDNNVTIWGHNSIKRESYIFMENMAVVALCFFL